MGLEFLERLSEGLKSILHRLWDRTTIKFKTHFKLSEIVAGWKDSRWRAKVKIASSIPVLFLDTPLPTLYQMYLLFHVERF